MISTPHRGSFFVDHFFETVSLKLLPSFLLIYMLRNGGSDGSAFNYARPGDM
jgi:triacylglycerol lipase